MANVGRPASAPSWVDEASQSRSPPATPRQRPRDPQPPEPDRELRRRTHRSRPVQRRCREDASMANRTTLTTARSRLPPSPRAPNTSNPQVMVAAGSASPATPPAGADPATLGEDHPVAGSKVVMDYLQNAGLIQPLEALGFHLAGFGCMTCIGASGPLIEGGRRRRARARPDRRRLVLSGNRISRAESTLTSR